MTRGDAHPQHGIENACKAPGPGPTSPATPSRSMNLPPGRAFGVLFLHAYDARSLQGRTAFTDLFDALGMACLCPLAPHAWWADRICPAFDPRRHAGAATSSTTSCPRSPSAGAWGPGPSACWGSAWAARGRSAWRFKHPETFPVVAGIAPAIEYHELYGQGLPLDDMYDSKEQCRQDTAPMHIHPARFPPHLFFCCDPDDADWFRGNDRLHEKLSALGVAHEARPDHAGRRPHLGVLQPHGRPGRALPSCRPGAGEPAAPVRSHAHVSLMVTCLGDALFPEVGVATVRLLRRLGVDRRFPRGPDLLRSAALQQRLPRRRPRPGPAHARGPSPAADLVVTPSGSCAAMVKLEYPELFHDDPVWRARPRTWPRRTHELSDFLVNVLGVEDVGARFAGRVTYHMACHLRGLGLLTEPERLLRRVRGLELVPLERADECCGFGGSFSVRYPAISGAMVQDKAAFIEKAGVRCRGGHRRRLPDEHRRLPAPPRQPHPNAAPGPGAGTDVSSPPALLALPA